MTKTYEVEIFNNDTFKTTYEIQEFKTRKEAEARFKKLYNECKGTKAYRNKAISLNRIENETGTILKTRNL